MCVCVCLLSHISPLQHLFILNILSCTQRATEVKKFVGCSYLFGVGPLRNGTAEHVAVGVLITASHFSRGSQLTACAASQCESGSCTSCLPKVVHIEKRV